MINHPELVDHYGPQLSMGRIQWWMRSSPFIVMHLLCFTAIWTGVSWWSVGLCVGLYYLRMFGVTGGYHRYFSHRTFKCNRFVQFCFAMLAQSSAQKGALWWAANHRHHHRHSDDSSDFHSPRHGFWHAHVGWILDNRFDQTDYKLIPDLAKFPRIAFPRSLPAHSGDHAGRGLLLGRWLGRRRRWLSLEHRAVLAWHLLH